MKKLLAVVAAVAAFSAQAETLTVAATPVPHAEILEFVKPALAKEGVDLKVKVFTDYIQPNVQVAEKRLDANFFQHQPYLDEFNKAKGTHLVSVAGVHLEPLGAYSTKYKTLAELPSTANVVIPNDATNGGRALLLLDKAGVMPLAWGENGYREISNSKKAIKSPEDLKGLKMRTMENPVHIAAYWPTPFRISCGSSRLGTLRSFERRWIERFRRVCSTANTGLV